MREGREMRKRRLVLVLACLCGMAGTVGPIHGAGLRRTAQAGESLVRDRAADCNVVRNGGKRRAWAGKRSGPLVIDGKADESDWQTAPAATGFKVLRNAGKLADPQTTVRMLYDPEHLFFLLEAEAPPHGAVVTTAAEDGRQLFSDSHMEIFLGNQKLDGNHAVVGMMLESNIHEGNQKNTGDLKTMTYGVSITDECISWETTENLLRTAHEQLMRNGLSRSGAPLQNGNERYSVAAAA